MDKEEIIEYLMSIIEHGSDADLFRLYNAYITSTDNINNTTEEI